MTTESPTAPVEEKPVEQTPPAVTQTEDEKIWAEIIASEAPETAQSSGTGEQVSHEFAPAVTELKADAGNVVSEGADKPTDVAAKSTDAPAATAPKEDIWANASPELRAAHEAEVANLRKATNDAKAHAGRMRKMAEELKASAPREADKSGSKKVSDILDEGLAEYPEVRKPVQDALAPIEKQLERLDQREASTRAAQGAEVDDHIRRESRILEAKHPNWMTEYVTGPRAKQFYDWVLDQPRETRETVFVTNKDDIFDADAADKVFTAFKTHITPPEPNPPPANDGGQTQELSARRAAQLEGTVSPRSPGGAPRVSGIPKEGDPAAIWSAIPDDNADDRLKGGSFSRRRA